jgi:mannose-binding lectin 2
MHIHRDADIYHANKPQARGIRGASIPTRAKVTYFQDRSLKLELKYKFEEVWEPCFETGPVPIPSVAYLGFSAETGELSDNFDIISVETKNLYDSSKMNLVKEPTKNLKGGGKEKKDKAAKKDFERKKKASKAAAPDTSEKRGWGSFFVKVVVFFIVCVGGYIGFTVWRTSSKRHSRFD